ncbi:MAG: hypothetical protein LBP71_06005 [Spirochaetaceae bacterium]|jgi:hypothetical protein|nr:hypothetical protein [Spirochaetaceae bacterium]
MLYRYTFAASMESMPVPGNSLAESLAWLRENAAEGGAYAITLNADEAIAPYWFEYGGKTVSVTLSGGAAKWTVDLSETGALFGVETGVTLTLGNTTSDNSGGGVFVGGNGTFTMEGGEIRGNTANNGGGGVFVSLSGAFTMKNGAISGNTASSGGGVPAWEPSSKRAGPFTGIPIPPIRRAVPKIPPWTAPGTRFC